MGEFELTGVLQEPPAGSSPHAFLRWELRILRAYTKEVCFYGELVVRLLKAVRDDDEDAGRETLRRAYSMYAGGDAVRIDRIIDQLEGATLRLLAPVGIASDPHDPRPGSSFDGLCSQFALDHTRVSCHETLLVAVNEILVGILTDQVHPGDLSVANAKGTLPEVVSGLDWQRVRQFFDGCEDLHYRHLIRRVRRENGRAQVHAHVAFYAGLSAGRRPKRHSAGELVKAVYKPLAGVNLDATSKKAAPRFFNQN